MVRFGSVHLTLQDHVKILGVNGTPALRVSAFRRVEGFLDKRGLSTLNKAQDIPPLDTLEHRRHTAAMVVLHRYTWQDLGSPIRGCERHENGALQPRTGGNGKVTHKPAPENLHRQSVLTVECVHGNSSFSAIHVHPSSEGDCYRWRGTFPHSIRDAKNNIGL
ncbi:hypothetical protein E2C01_099142 [Portunus trituberculatus]|uniref:Uncharacterized protein n=1 Tax=Portunus trituberculatus TaxID=210409 RepID=A0A5B7JZJ3_PORTR|nr:hypothetical protein [Portunus trituberculatus]